MSFSSPSTPKLPPPPEPEQDPAIEARRKAELERLRKMRGRKSTIMTGSQGVTGETIGKKTLLGE